MRRNGNIGQWMESYNKAISSDKWRQPGSDKFSDDNGCGMGVELRDIPPSIASTPFTYIDMKDGGKQHKIAFKAGMVAVVQRTDTLALEPVVGWGVVYV